tara:strand:- start:106 stop:237 length:132 start_codon:yes stop_codon:yes gene_type:complete
VDELLTFAAPLVGDAAFARAFDASPLGTQHTASSPNPNLDPEP